MRWVAVVLMLVVSAGCMSRTLYTSCDAGNCGPGEVCADPGTEGGGPDPTCWVLGPDGGTRPCEIHPVCTRRCTAASDCPGFVNECSAAPHGTCEPTHWCNESACEQ